MNSLKWVAIGLVCFASRRVEAGVPATSRPAVATTQGASLKGLVYRAVEQAQGVVRRANPPHATAAQREQLAGQKQVVLDAIVESVREKTGPISFRVVDVEVDGTGYRIFGEFENPSLTLLTAEQRAMMAKIRAEAATQARKAKKGRESGRLGLSTLDEPAVDGETAQKKIAAVRHRAEVEKPLHRIELVTDDVAVMRWKKGEARAVTCRVVEFSLNVVGRRPMSTTEEAAGDAAHPPLIQLIDDNVGEGYVQARIVGVMVTP